MDQLSSIKIAKSKVKVQGILMMLVAAICFAAVAILIKFVPNVPLMEIILFRNIPIMLIIPLILINKGIPILGNNKPLLLLQGVFTVFALASYIYSSGKSPPVKAGMRAISCFFRSCFTIMVI